MPKVYVDVLEIWDDSMIAKGIPTKKKEMEIKTQMYKDCILGSVFGKGWEAEPIQFRMFKVVPHTHEMITFNFTKELFRFFNVKVFIPYTWRPEQGDYQTLSLGHKAVPVDELVDLEEERKEWER